MEGLEKKPTKPQQTVTICASQMFVLRWQQSGRLSLLFDQLNDSIHLYEGDLPRRWHRIDKYVCAGLCLLSVAQFLGSALYIVEWVLGELDERDLFPDVNSQELRCV